MAKTLVILNFLLCSIITAMMMDVVTSGRPIVATPNSDSPFPRDHYQWLSDPIPVEEEKFTKLHFYLHDFVTGPNQSVYNIAESSITRDSDSWFGRVQVADHLLTMGPDPESEEVGRLQGVHVMADLHKAALGMNWNFVFNDGSTITVVGRLVVAEKEGELSIIGGTGQFLMARGIAWKKTLSTNPQTMNSLMEYTMYVYSSAGLELPGM